MQRQKDLFVREKHIFAISWSHDQAGMLFNVTQAPDEFPVPCKLWLEEQKIKIKYEQGNLGMGSQPISLISSVRLAQTEASFSPGWQMEKVWHKSLALHMFLLSKMSNKRHWSKSILKTKSRNLKKIEGQIYHIHNRTIWFYIVSRNMVVINKSTHMRKGGFTGWRFVCIGGFGAISCGRLLLWNSIPVH